MVKFKTVMNKGLDQNAVCLLSRSSTVQSSRESHNSETGQTQLSKSTQAKHWSRRSRIYRHGQSQTENHKELVW